MAHPTAHLLIDMVNPFDFPGADRLFPPALEAARHIAALKRRLHDAGVPTVYVNDNFGRWELSFRDLVELYRSGESPAAALLEVIGPERGDHFILKPKHSGFYATSLEVLLARWGTRRLILTGIAGNICVMFTADDAHMRDYSLVVPCRLHRLRGGGVQRVGAAPDALRDGRGYPPVWPHYARAIARTAQARPTTPIDSVVTPGARTRPGSGPRHRRTAMVRAHGARPSTSVRRAPRAQRRRRRARHTGTPIRSAARHRPPPPPLRAGRLPHWP